MKLSIIVPVYNASNYLENCVYSICKQSIFDFEVILVDDGSSDGSGELCDLIGMNDNRIKVIHQENEGVSSARNAGLRIAKGEWIGFVDSDDTIDSCMYDKMIINGEKTDSDICICGYKTVSSTATQYYLPPFEGILDRREIIKKYMPFFIGRNGYKSVLGSCGRCIYKRDILAGVEFQKRLRVLEDTIFNFDVLNKANRICFIKECLYEYHVNSASATNIYRKDALYQINILVEELDKRKKILYKKRVDVRENYYNTLFDFFVYLLKNSKKDGNSFTVRQRVNYIKELSCHKEFQKMLRLFSPKKFKQKALITLVNKKMFWIVEALI